MQPRTGQAPAAASHPRRPRSVTWLAFGVLIFTMLFLVRLVQSLLQWAFLREILDVSPLYLALSGLVWFVTGAILFWGLLGGWRYTPVAFRIVMVLYLLYYWIDRLWVAKAPTRLASLPFAAGMSILVPLVIAWILSRSRAKAFFGEKHG